MVESARCVPQLASRCLGLRKLFLTAIRNVDDESMRAIAEWSHDLEQLDVRAA